MNCFPGLKVFMEGSLSLFYLGRGGRGFCRGDAGRGGRGFWWGDAGRGGRGFCRDIMRAKY